MYLQETRGLREGLTHKIETWPARGADSLARISQSGPWRRGQGRREVRLPQREGGWFAVTTPLGEVFAP